MDSWRAKRMDVAREKGLCLICTVNPSRPHRRSCERCSMLRQKQSARRRQAPRYKLAHRKYIRKWREKNLDKIRGIQRSHVARTKMAVFSHYGEKCACCNERALEFLVIDHINGNGKEHLDSNGRRLGGHRFYRWLLNHGLPIGFQTLCWNCNAAKQIYGKCPHQRRTACNSR